MFQFHPACAEDTSQQIPAKLRHKASKPARANSLFLVQAQPPLRKVHEISWRHGKTREAEPSRALAQSEESPARLLFGYAARYVGAINN